MIHLLSSDVDVEGSVEVEWARIWWWDLRVYFWRSIRRRKDAAQFVIIRCYPQAYSERDF